MPGSTALHAIVPDAPVPGAYAGRMIDALGRAGCRLILHRLPGPPGQIDRNTMLAADIVMARLPDRARVILDGDLLPNLASAVALDARRLQLTVLLDRTAPDPEVPESGLCLARRRLELGSLALMRCIVVAEDAAAAALRTAGIEAERILVAAADESGASRLAALLSDAAGRQAEPLHNA